MRPVSVLVLAAVLVGGAGIDGRYDAPPADPVLLAAGDIADCDTATDSATADLLDDLPGTIATLGDNVYPSGTAEDFRDCYAPTWGRHLARTRPSPGNQRASRSRHPAPLGHGCHSRWTADPPDLGTLDRHAADLGLAARPGG